MSAPNPTIAQARAPKGTLRYPYDVDKSPYYTMLRFRAFKRQEPTQRPQEEDLGTIMLPLPGELMESYNVTYGQPALGAMGLAIKDMGETSSVESNAAAVKARMADGKFIEDAAVTSAQQIIGSLSQGADAAMSLVIGNAPNPHMRSIFENVPLRLFSYTWKIAPRTPDEGRSIRQIVNTIRKHSLPRDNNGGLRLSFPDELYIDFIGKHADFLPKIRKCVVTSVSLNHARNGTPSFFHDGTPTHMELALQIQEVNQITRESFGD